MEKEEELMEDEFDDGFDISIYENEAEKDDEPETDGENYFNNTHTPPVSNAKVKFNPGEMEIEQLANLKGEIKKASVEIAGQIANTNQLRRYYGLLSELWANLELVSGKLWINYVDSLRKECWEAILNAEIKKTIEPSVYYKLLKLRKCLYKIAQAKNLGFAVENIKHTGIKTAKEGIL